MRKLISEKKFNIAVLILFLLPFFYMFGSRAYDTQLLPFQSTSIQCDMDGKQKFLSSYAKYAPKLTFPRSFKMKFKFIDGEYLRESDKFPLLDNDKFGYQAVNGQYIIKPSYNKWGDSYWIILTKGFEGIINYAYIDYMTTDHYGDYDAIYNCREISQ